MLVKTEAKRWGNSLGFVIPRAVVESENIKEHQELDIIILPKSKNVLKDLFGTAKGKLIKPTQQIKDELRSELYND